MKVHVPAGVATGVGSLPHIDAAAAAEFVLLHQPDLPAIPSLPIVAISTPVPSSITVSVEITPVLGK